MSSISSTSTSANHPALFVDFQAPDQYSVGIQDDDGTVERRTMSEAELNALLAASGLRFVNGQVQALDGFELTSSALNVVSSHGGAQPLPDVSGSTANP